jgi:tetratricopeptide (TPR) repeat protein
MLGGCYCNVGEMVRDDGRAAESLDFFNKAIKILSHVYSAQPRDVTAKQFLGNTHEGRARAYDALAKYDEALSDWDQAIQLSQPSMQLLFRAGRASTRLKAGQVAEALAEAAELTKSSKWDAGQWYDFARVYAVASGKLADKKAEYADRAIELLTLACAAGYKDASHMKQDTDLYPLRNREDFKKLMGELEKKAETKK